MSPGATQNQAPVKLTQPSGKSNMRRRRIKPVKDAEEHVIHATDKTDKLEAKHINDYKGRLP